MRDQHHILHNRQEWELRPEARRLRGARTLMPELDRRVHDEIHAVCPPVPLLGYYALRLIEQNFEEGRNTLQSMDNLMHAIDLSAAHPKTHYIERGMADLAIQAIELQRPWIADGMRHIGLVA
jgi:hypothetical protein